jgi:hypothetical protein
LAPNQYIRNVTLKNGSILRLVNGKYYFDNLNMTAGARLEIDHSAGHTEVYVRNSMLWHDGANIQNLGGDPFAHLFAVFGTSVNIDGSFSGTLVAPRGDIVLASRPHWGAFYSGFVLDVHQDAVVRHRPLHCGQGATQGDPGGGGGPTQPPAPSAALQITGQWWGGYCASLNVTNNAAQATSDWSVSLDLNGATIYTSWNGDFSGSTGVVSVSPGFGWNQSIPANQTDGSVGYCANHNQATNLPSPSIVNATAQYP